MSEATDESSSNIDVKNDGKKLTITVDLTKSFGKSSSGKSEVVAHQRINKDTVPGFYFTLGLFKQLTDEKPAAKGKK